MAFNPISTSSPSSSTAELIANNTLLGFELEVNSIMLAIAQAKEQLH